MSGYSGGKSHHPHPHAHHQLPHQTAAPAVSVPYRGGYVPPAGPTPSTGYYRCVQTPSRFSYVADKSDVAAFNASSYARYSNQTVFQQDPQHGSAQLSNFYLSSPIYPPPAPPVRNGDPTKSRIDMAVSAASTYQPVHRAMPTPGNAGTMPFHMTAPPRVPAAPMTRLPAPAAAQSPAQQPLQYPHAQQPPAAQTQSPAHTTNISQPPPPTPPGAVPKNYNGVNAGACVMLLPSTQSSATPAAMSGYSFIPPNQENAAVAVSSSLPYQPGYWPAYAVPRNHQTQPKLRVRNPVPILDPVTKEPLVYGNDSSQKEAESSTGTNLEAVQQIAALVAKAASRSARGQTVTAQCSEPPPQLPEHNGLSDNGVVEVSPDPQEPEPLAPGPTSAAPEAEPEPAVIPADTECPVSSNRQQNVSQQKKRSKQKLRELSQRAESRSNAGDMEAFLDAERPPPPPAVADQQEEPADVPDLPARTETPHSDVEALVTAAERVKVSSPEEQADQEPVALQSPQDQPAETAEPAKPVESSEQPATSPSPAALSSDLPDEPEVLPSAVNGGSSEDVEASDPPLNSAVHRVLDELRSTGESRKHYDRETLLKLQQHPLSRKRPTNFPDLSVVRYHGQSSRNVLEKSRSIGPMSGFMDSRPHAKLRPRGSQGRRDVPGQQHHMLPPRRMEIVLNRDVKLQSSENAWKRATDDVNDSTTVLRTFRGTLNKLTPSNANRLIESIVKLSADFRSYQLVTDVIEVLFDKALAEPAYAELYAKVCSSISKTEVERTNSEGVVSTVYLRKILVERCQREFQQDNRGKLNKEARLKEIDAEPDEAVRRQKKVEIDEESRKIRVRSNGNIRFIGELFKLDLLNAGVMHKCISKLFTDGHEDSYECMCKLLSTIGAKLERNNSMDQQFSDIKKLTKRQDISSRIRFMVEDLIELRDNKWVSSRVGDIARPMTIEEVHEQARQEEETQRQRLAMVDDRRLPPPSRNSLGGVDRRRAMPPLPSRQPTLASLSALSRMKQSGHSLKLGPGGAGSGWSSGSKGAKGSGRSVTAGSSFEVTNTNKFLMLSPDDGEETKPAPARKIAAPAASCSGPPVVSALQQQRLCGPSNVTSDNMTSIVKSIVNGLIEHNNFDEAVEECQKSLHEATVKAFVSQCIDILIDSSSHKRHTAGELHRVLLERELITTQQYNQALLDTLEFIADLECDVPTLWKDLAELLTPALLPQSVSQPAMFSLVQLGNCAEHVRSAGKGAIMLREILRRVADLKGRGVLRTLVPAKFDWGMFFTEGEDHVQLLSEWQMGFLAPHEPEPLPVSCVPDSQARVSRLVEAARRHGVGLPDWLKSERLLPAASPEEQMLLASDLLAALCFDSVMASEGGQTVYEKRLEQFTDLMKHVVSDDVEREVACLNQLILLWVHLNYPPLLLDRWFRVLSDSDVISDTAFLKWHANPASCKGIGSAIASTKGFFDELICVAAEERT